MIPLNDKVLLQRAEIEGKEKSIQTKGEKYIERWKVIEKGDGCSDFYQKNDYVYTIKGQPYYIQELDLYIAFNDDLLAKD